MVGYQLETVKKSCWDYYFSIKYSFRESAKRIDPVEYCKVLFSSFHLYLFQSRECHDSIEKL